MDVFIFVNNRAKSQSKVVNTRIIPIHDICSGNHSILKRSSLIDIRIDVLNFGVLQIAVTRNDSDFKAECWSSSSRALDTRDIDCKRILCVVYSVRCT